MKLTMHDLYEIEAGVKLDDSGFAYTPIRGDELLALIRIARACVDCFPLGMQSERDLDKLRTICDELRKAGLIA